MQGNGNKDRYQLVYIDPEGEGLIPYRMDEGLSFGLGFFETILIREIAFYLQEHLDRLNDSLEQFGFHCFVARENVEELIGIHRLRNTACKLIVTEKNGFVTTRPVPYDPQSYEVGAFITMSGVTRSMHSQLIRHKSLNYGEQILELRRARAKGFDDCLFFNERGYVTESTRANLFIIQSGKLITPPVSDGLLPGIIRQKIVDHFPACEEHITREQLTSCQGAFLTNSLLGVMPISQIEDVRLKRHPLCQVVMDHFGPMLR